MLFFLTVGALFFSILLGLLGIFGVLYRDRVLITSRLDNLNQNKKWKRNWEVLQQPLRQRLWVPLWGKLSRFFSQQMGSGMRLHFQLKLQSAGNPGGLDAGGFRLIQYLLAAVLTILFGIGGWMLKQPPLTVLLCCGCGLLFGVYCPQFYLNFKSTERRQSVIHSLPDALDLLMVSVEAGLAFELALVKVTEHFKGVLAEEFRRVLQDMKLGKPRRDALKDMAERVGSDDLSAFVGSLTQADQLGVSISNILRIQSAQMRQRRRQRAEEKAMKAPIKMLIPLIFFIFPALMVVLLGPAVIQVSHSFLQ